MERRTTEIHNPACSECRARKLKCSRSRPACGFCTKHQKECNYASRRSRAPLTKAYVSSLEQRVKRLEQMLLAANPSINLDDSTVRDDLFLETQSSSDFPIDERAETSPTGQDSLSRLSTPDSLPARPSGFDWGTEDDTAEKSEDGQNISLSPEGAGYLGKFTRVALLRTLQKIGCLWNNAPTRSPICPSHLQLIGESSNCIPWEALECSDSSGGFAEFLIDAYFRHFHTTYPVLHEPTFRAQYSEVIPRPPAEAWSLLSRTVFAIGAWCTGCRIVVGNDSDPSDCFQLFEGIGIFRSGSLSMVQALTLFGCYLHKQSKSNSCSIYLSAAVKMGMSLGLHREFPDWNISLLDREMRRRVWWCLYVLESGHSIAMGRPILLPCYRTIDIKPPLNISEQSLTARTKTEPKAYPGLTIYSNLKAQAEFHLMINETYNRCINSPDVPSKDLLDADAKIEVWMKSLPPHLQEDFPVQGSFTRLNFASPHLLWRVSCLKIVLFFPTVVQFTRRYLEIDQEKGTIEQQEAVRVCVNYAHTIITSIELFFAKEPSNPLRDWYARYCLIQSALVLILTLQANFDFLQDDRPTLISDFDKMKILLEKVSGRDTFAKMILDIMNQVTTSPPHGNFSVTATTIMGGDFDDLSTLPLDGQFDTLLWPLWNESDRGPAL